MKTLKVFLFALISSFSVAAPAEMIKEWVCWGPGWGRGGLAVSAFNYEANLSPQPGDMDLSQGTDRTRLVPWIKLETSDGLVDFFSNQFPVKNISDGAGQWAGGASYAFVYIHSEKKQSLRLKIGTSQTLFQWLNGKSLKRAGAYCRLNLNKGWNRLLIKSLSPSKIRSKKIVMPSNGKHSSWTFSAILEQLNGSSKVYGIKFSVTDPNRSNNNECIGFLSKLTALDGTTPLFTTKSWNGKLKLHVSCRSGQAEIYQSNPIKRYRPRGNYWIYTRRPTKDDNILTIQELKAAVPEKLQITITNYMNQIVYKAKQTLAFDRNCNASMTLELSDIPTSQPDFYSVELKWLDNSGKVMVYNNHHSFAITGGPVSLNTDVPRKIACVGHWMTNTDDFAKVKAKLEWLNKTGITWHQKMSQAWNRWGIKFDTKGNVTFKPRKVVDETIELANKLNIRLIGDLSMGYVQTDQKRKGQLMALTEDEAKGQQKKSQEMASAKSIRLIPFGSAPLPFYGTPEFNKVLTAYAEKLVSYYKGKINYWCGDNEIDLHSGRGTTAEAIVYSAAAALYYKAMKRANPKATFISASLCRSSGITAELFKHGYANNCDWLDVHAHPYGAPNMDSSTIGNTPFEGLGLAQQKTDKPIVYGEVSAPLAHSITGVVGQATAVPKQIAWVLNQKRIKLFAYLVPYSNGANLGFCNVYGDPLPAACAINAASRLLDGREILKNINLPSGIQQLRVKNGRNDIIMLWSEKPKKLSIRLTSNKVEIFNELGTPVKPVISGSSLILNVTTSPIYLMRY